MRITRRTAKKTLPPLLEPDLFSAGPDARALRALSAALGEGRLFAQFQPVMRAGQTEHVAFYECLARIRTADGEILSAGPLIAAAEESDLARLLDRQILRQALAVLEDNPRVRLSVNLSALGVGDEAWLDVLREAAMRAPHIPELLIVEITETATLELDQTRMGFLNELRRLGVSLAIDDFGAGRSSIGHLGKVRFDIMKIDGCYCEDITTNPDSQFWVKTMLSMAAHYEMLTVAEKVNCESAAAMLAEFGVDCVQGFAFGRPDDLPTRVGGPTIN